MASLRAMNTGGIENRAIAIPSELVGSHNARWRGTGAPAPVTRWTQRAGLFPAQLTKTWCGWFVGALTSIDGCS
jgi:hypothetical protein